MGKTKAEKYCISNQILVLEGVLDTHLSLILWNTRKREMEESLLEIKPLAFTIAFLLTLYFYFSTMYKADSLLNIQQLFPLILLYLR